MASDMLSLWSQVLAPDHCDGQTCNPDKNLFFNCDGTWFEERVLFLPEGYYEDPDWLKSLNDMSNPPSNGDEDDGYFEQLGKEMD